MPESRNGPQTGQHIFAILPAWSIGDNHRMMTITIRRGSSLKTSGRMSNTVVSRSWASISVQHVGAGGGQKGGEMNVVHLNCLLKAEESWNGDMVCRWKHIGG